MKEVKIHIIYFQKLLNSLKIMISKPFSSALLIPTISLGIFTTIQIALIMLFFAYVIDFITGIYASYIEHKKNPKPVKVYILESSKMRKSIVKAISYFVFIAFSYAFEKVFLIKAFSVLSISDLQFTITSIACIFCFAIEFFSILENLKRSGYDLLGKAEGVIKKFWKFVGLVKGETSKIEE